MHRKIFMKNKWTKKKKVVTHQNAWYLVHTSGEVAPCKDVKQKSKTRWTEKKKMQPMTNPKRQDEIGYENKVQIAIES